MKKLSNTTTIYELSKECSQTPEIMENLGFGPANKTGMIQSAGRFMTLEKAVNKRKSLMKMQRRLLEKLA